MAENDQKTEKSDKKSTENEPKVRKITDKDFKKVEVILKNEFQKRKDSTYRTSAEQKWKEVDRQISMEPVEFANLDDETSWLAAFELGELGRASEIMTSDLIRVVFPESRSWFEAHVEIEQDIDPVSGESQPVDKKYQEKVDGLLRSFMTQQHRDFGLRDRVELSIKEALHHGMFVAEVDEESMDMYFNGTSVKEITSPVWIPHSMWNCYPDPSPSIIGHSMFYQGSMFIRRFMPRHKFIESAVGDGWIPKALKKIPKRENEQKDSQDQANKTKDLEIITFWGDITIPKGSEWESSDQDLFFPNYKAITANGKLVYIENLKLPYKNLIVRGYERTDVRNPYATSPLIKQSPMQKMGSLLASEFVNGAQLNTRPPLTYDANDPDFVVNGGPRIAPGAKTPTKGRANFQQMTIGDPSSTMVGLQFVVGQMKESLGRPGIAVGDRATREEVLTKQVDSEAGPFGFAIKLDDSLRSFLYMQHYMNKLNKNLNYSYYNPELDSPDFQRVKASELPDTVHFEVVGSKGVLGEARRQQGFLQATTFLAQNQLTSGMLELVEIAKQVYMDAGIKNPERFLKQGDLPPDVQAKLVQMNQVVARLSQELKDERSQSAVKLQKMQLDFVAKMAKIKESHIKNISQIALKYHESTDKTEQNVDKMVKELRHEIELMLAEGTQIDNQ